MRFRQSAATPSYLNRKFQLRMILMVGTLAAVVFAIKTTANPKFWERWFPEEKESASVAGENAPAVFDKKESLPKPGALNLDEVLIQNQSTDTGQPTEPDEKVAEDLSSLPELTQQFGKATVEVDLDRLSQVEDYSVGVKANEAEAFYYLLWHAGRVPLDELKVAGQQTVAREALLASPEHFRGQTITIEGDLRSLVPRQASTNIYQIGSYFDARVIPPGAGNIPWHIVASEIDGTLPVEESIAEEIPVRVTGYFPKSEGYAATSRLQIAPLFVARKIELLPATERPALISETSDPSRWLFFIFCGVFAIAIFAVVRSIVGSKRSKAYRKTNLETAPDLGEIQGADSIDPGKQLSELAKRDADN